MGQMIVWLRSCSYGSASDLIRFVACHAVVKNLSTSHALSRQKRVNATFVRDVFLNAVLSC